jgi:N-acetyl-alpha-D-glucosaminyl L-malate synthase BshA
MKIGIVCYPTFGGSGVVATELGIALANKGHQVHFISYSLPVRLGKPIENIFYHEVQVSDYPLFEYTPYELVLTSTLVDVARRENLDLLHVHYAIPHASAAYMAKMILQEEGIRVPFITTLHGTDITLVGKDSSFEPVITFAMNKSDAVTAVSQSLKDDTLSFFHINRDIEVIPNFINMNEYDIDPKESLKCYYAPCHEKIICHISNFRKVKRIEDVIHVFKNVNTKIPSKLLLVGDGPERHKIEKLCDELKLQNEVIMLGNLRKTIDVLKISDLFLLTSETESFGLAALEAMAAGVPVISSNTGGIPEVNKQGFSGFLSDVGNVEEMSKNAIHILSSDDRLNEFKKNARHQALAFDIERILPVYEKLYESVLLS